MATPNWRATRVLAAALLATLALSPLFPETAEAATVPYTLWGRNTPSPGWSFTNANYQDPGPPLYANKGDTVDLDLNAPGGTHFWYLDYNNNTNDDAGEPKSPNFSSGSPAAYPFTANQGGTYPYRCGFHNLMKGYFQINQTEPSVSISQPTGAQDWTGGSAHDVVWTMTDDQSPVTALVAYLNYSSVAGNGVIAGPVMGSTNPHTEPWTLPLVNATDMTVNITVIDPDGNKGYAEALVPTVDSAAPTISSTSPMDSATGVSTSTWINVTFNEGMDQVPTEGAASLRKLPEWTSVAFTAQSWVGNTMRLKPNALLSPGTTYVFNLTTAALDDSDPGNALAAPFSSQFTTGNNAPTAAITVPAGASSWTGGSAHDVTFTMSDDHGVGALTAWLNYSYDGGASTGAIAGPITGATSPNTESWTVPLANATDVTVNLTMVDPAGAVAYDEALVPEVDSAPPNVTAVDPADTATNVSTGTWINLTFSEGMDQAATEAAVTLEPAVAVSLSWSGNTLTVEPMAVLAEGTTYWVNVSNAAADDSDPGNPLATFSSRFTTLAGPPPPNLPPSITIPTPAGGEVWTGGTPHLIEFVASDPDTPLAQLVVNVYASATGAAPWQAFELGLNGTATNATWNTLLADSTVARIRATVTDGNASVENLSAEFSLDSTDPAVASRSPAADATNVTINTNVLVGFSEPVNTSETSWFGVQNLSDGSWLAGSLQWNVDGDSLIFDPDAFLAPGTTYRVHVNASVRDLSDPGNAMSADEAWNFTTGNTTDVTPPEIANATASPDPAAVDEPVNVTADVTDDVDVAWVQLVIRLGATEFFNGSMTPANSPWYHEQAFALPDTYDYAITAADTSGNENATAGQFTVHDVVPPEITATASPDPAPFQAAVNITATVTDDVAVANVTLVVRLGASEVFNGTMTPGGSDVWFHEQGYAPAGTYDYTVTATDSSSNTNATSGNFTMLSDSPPEFSFLLATPDPAVVDTVVNVTVTVTDDVGIGAVDLVVTLNGTEVFNGSMSAEATSYYHAQTYGDVGTYGFTITATDTASQANATGGTFTVVPDRPPEVRNVTADPNPAQWNDTVNVSAIVTDDVGLLDDPIWAVILVVSAPGWRTINVTMYPAGGDVWGVDWNFYVGTWNATVRATDTLGQTNESTIVVIVHPPPPPVIEEVVVTPDPAEVPAVVNISVNATTATGWPATVLVNVSGDLQLADWIENTSWHYRLFPVSVPGAYDFTVRARFLGSNHTWHNASFTAADTTPPTIHDVLAPTSPEANASADFAVNATDNWGIAAAWIEVAGIANHSLTLNGSLFTASFALPRGTHALSAGVEDLAGLVTLVTVNVTAVDTDPPTIGHTPLPSWTPWAPLLVTFNATDDEGLADVRLSYLDSRGRAGSESLTLPPPFSAAIPALFVEGTVNYTIRVTDVAGNAAEATYSVAVSGPPPYPPLYGVVAGWGATAGSIASPGPALEIPEGGNLTLLVIGFDDELHFLFVDLDADGDWDASEPRWDDVVGVSTVATLGPLAPGNYTYRCGAHPGTMFGTLRMLANATDGGDDGDGGETPGGVPAALLGGGLLLLALLAVAAFLLLKRRKPVKEEEAEPEEDEGKEPSEEKAEEKKGATKDAKDKKPPKEKEPKPSEDEEEAEELPKKE